MRERPQFSLQAFHVALFAFIVFVLVLSDRYRVQKHDWEVRYLQDEIIALQGKVNEWELWRKRERPICEDRIDVMSQAVRRSDRGLQAQIEQLRLAIQEGVYPEIQILQARTSGIEERMSP